MPVVIPLINPTMEDATTAAVSPMNLLIAPIAPVAAPATVALTTVQADSFSLAIPHETILDIVPIIAPATAPPIAAPSKEVTAKKPL